MRAQIAFDDSSERSQRPTNGDGGVRGAYICVQGKVDSKYSGNVLKNDVHFMTAEYSVVAKQEILIRYPN